MRACDSISSAEVNAMQTRANKKSILTNVKWCLNFWLQMTLATDTLNLLSGIANSKKRDSKTKLIFQKNKVRF